METSTSADTPARSQYSFRSAALKREKGTSAGFVSRMFVSELTRKVVAQRSCTQFWNRKAAGSHNQSGSVKFVGGVADNYKKIGAANLFYVAIQKYLHAGGAAFGLRAW